MRDGDTQWYVTARYPSPAVAQNSQPKRRIHGLDTCSSQPI